MAVPRYFFHVHDLNETIDLVGSELDGSEQARVQAVEASGEMLKDFGAKFWKHEYWRMWVTDEAGETVCALRFSSEKIVKGFPILEG